MATTNFTNGVTLSDAAWFDDVDTAVYSYLTGTAGTNTITATGPTSMGSYAAGQIFRFIPAATNTGATTINITPSGGSALGAKNIFSGGAACVGGEIVINVPCAIIYDGTQFNIINALHLTSGILDLSLGSLVGVKFDATQNASADANTLDDYEEGTFTPGVSFGGGTTGITYSAQVGSYTKIGNRVFFNAYVALSAKGSSSGTAVMTGLPVASANVANLLPSCSLVCSSINLDVAGGYYQLVARVQSNSTAVDLLEQGDNVALAVLTEADFVDTSTLNISGHYRV